MNLRPAAEMQNKKKMIEMTMIIFFTLFVFSDESRKGVQDADEPEDDDSTWTVINVY